MSERMNKERAIELLKAIKEEDDIKYCNYKERYYKALDIAIESLDNEWVDVRDRLPKESGWYWVTQKFDFKGEFEHQNETDYEVDKEWFDSTKNEFDYTHKYIIAWRTYYEPQPYKRKE